jgi:hypothetical protein
LCSSRLCFNPPADRYSAAWCDQFVPSGCIMVWHITPRAGNLSCAYTLTPIACLKRQVFRDECQTVSAW